MGNIICGIYIIKSLVKPTRCYVGSSVNITKRWREHKHELLCGKHRNKRFQNHYNKYGEEDLVFSVLTCCDKEDLIKHEQYFIDALNPFFNICKIAGNTLGRMHTEECKKRMSDICKKRVGELNNFYGKTHSEEARKRMSEFRTGFSLSDATKEKISKYQKCKIVSDETRKRMSLASKRRPAYNKGIKLSKEKRESIYTEEVRAKMRQKWVERKLKLLKTKKT